MLTALDTVRATINEEIVQGWAVAMTCEMGISRERLG